MKYNIFDYNQKKAIELGLDLKDLLILNWIQTFSPKMHKTIRNNKQYVWVKYDAILSDIPILEIKSQNGLYKRMQKMCEIGILEYLQVRTSAGCFSYYLITELISELISGYSAESKSGSAESKSGSAESKSGSAESKSGSAESQGAIIYSPTINSPTINSPTINSKRAKFSQEFLDTFYFYKMQIGALKQIPTEFKETQEMTKAYQSWSKVLKDYNAEQIQQSCKAYFEYIEITKITWDSGGRPVRGDLTTWLNNFQSFDSWNGLKAQEMQKSKYKAIEEKQQEALRKKRIQDRLQDDIEEDTSWDS